MNEPFDDADLTPRPVSVPLHSLLDQVQDRLDERINRLGARFGGMLDGHAKVLEDQREWNAIVAGPDAKNGKVGRIDSFLAKVAAAAGGAALLAAGALWAAGTQKGDESARIRAVEAWVEKAEARDQRTQQLELQLLMRLAQFPPVMPALPTRSDTP